MRSIICGNPCAKTLHCNIEYNTKKSLHTKQLGIKTFLIYRDWVIILIALIILIPFIFEYYLAKFVARFSRITVTLI
jgi:hypothetical protein